MITITEISQHTACTLNAISDAWYRASNGKIYIGDDNEVKVYNPADNSTVSMSVYSNDNGYAYPTHQFGEYLRSFALYGNNIYWIEWGTYSGVYQPLFLKYDISTQEYSAIIPLSSTDFYRTDPRYNALCADEDGNIWVFTCPDYDEANAKIWKFNSSLSLLNSGSFSQMYGAVHRGLSYSQEWGFTVRGNRLFVTAYDKSDDEERLYAIKTNGSYAIDLSPKIWNDRLMELQALSEQLAMCLVNSNNKFCILNTVTLEIQSISTALSYLLPVSSNAMFDDLTGGSQANTATTYYRIIRKSDNQFYFYKQSTNTLYLLQADDDAQVTAPSNLIVSSPADANIDQDTGSGGGATFTTGTEDKSPPIADFSTVVTYKQPLEYASTFSEHGTGDGQLYWPDYLTADGKYIYVLDCHNNRVQIFDKWTFEFIGKFGSQGTGQGQFGNLNYAWGGIAVSSGYIFAGDAENLRIQIFDINTYAYVSEIPVNIYLEDLKIYDNKLYCCFWDVAGNYAVQIYNALTFAFITEFGVSGSGEGEFTSPYAIAVDEDYIYVSDDDWSYVNAVKVFNRNTYAYVTSFFDNSEGSTITGLSSHGNYIYIYDNVYDQVHAYNKGTWDLYNTIIPPDWSGWSIHVDNDYILLSDDAYDQIRVYCNSTTGLPASVTCTDLSQNQPTGWSWTAGNGETSISQNPTFTFTQTGNYTIRLNATNAFGSDEIDKRVTIEHKIVIDLPDGGTVDFYAQDAISGTYFIVDSTNHKVWMYDSGLNLIGYFGGYGTGDGLFNTPVYLVISGNYVYVVDSGNNRIQKFDLNGTYNSQWSVISPYGIASNDVYLYVTAGNSIIVYDMDGNEI